MGDPFEEAQPSPAAAPQLRESSIRQAVNFLNDPRVRSADPGKALSFLRAKSITDDELREAYRRTAIPFPSAAPLPTAPFPYEQQPPAPFPPPHGTVTPYFPHPYPQRPSWLSLFFGITAAAGIYAAARELLKRYIVPLYFPDAVRIAEEHRRRDEMAMRAQEHNIAELRERVYELLESSKKTNEKVEHLSTSISSSMALREREISQSSELRDAIRNLSHSVTASGGSERSQAAKSGVAGTTSGTVYPPFLSGTEAQKHGSLAYSYTNVANGSLAPYAGESNSRQLLTPLTRLNAEVDVFSSAKKSCNKALDESVASAQAVHAAEKTVAKENEDDEFMAIAPAEVEESWGAHLTHKTDASQKSNDQEMDEKNDAKQSKVDVAKVDGTQHAEEKGSDAILEGSREPSDVMQGNEDGNVVVARGLNEQEEENVPFLETTSFNAARQLFQNDLIDEANLVFGKTGTRRSRPLSMPQMDLPLSDAE